jgi:hypothetical protein
MPQPNDQSRSLVALDQNSTIIAVVELSQSSWLVAGMLPGIEREPRKKLEPSPERLLAVLQRTANKPKTLLDTKSPYRFESVFLLWRVINESVLVLGSADEMGPGGSSEGY